MSPLVVTEDVYLAYCDKALVAMRDMVTALGDGLANRRPDVPGANSPFAILTHCLGMTAYWASTVNLGEEVPRDRAAEFTATGRVADLSADTDRLRAAFAGWVARTEATAAPASPPEDGDIMLTQGEVLLHVYEELAQHRGQMEITRDVLLATSRPD
jgi:uncharacterized damage-inducible protein DinB